MFLLILLRNNKFFTKIEINDYQYIIDRVLIKWLLKAR